MDTQREPWNFSGVGGLSRGGWDHGDAEIEIWEGKTMVLISALRR
jgi:hypothetical protein